MSQNHDRWLLSRGRAIGYLKQIRSMSESDELCWIGALNTIADYVEARKAWMDEIAENIASYEDDED